MGLPVKVRLDLSKPINDKTLSLSEHLFVSYRDWRSKTRGARRRADKIKEQYLRSLQLEREGFREYLSILLQQHLGRGNLLKDNGIEEDASSIELHIDRSKADILDLCIKSGDFMAYEIREIEADPDILLCDPNIPIYLEVKNRLIND